MNKYICVFLVFCSFYYDCFSQSWIEMSPMNNYGRYVCASFTINNKAYVGLGQIYNGQKIYDFWEYDPLSNNWTKKADYPGKGSYATTAFSINGKGYICLGADNDVKCQNDLWEYDPVTNIWVKRADFPGLSRYGAVSFVIGNSGFVGTGSYNDPSDYLFDLWMYTPSTDTWIKKSNFPGGNRNHAVAFSIFGFGYLGTGAYTTYTGTNDFWKYNPVLDVWTRIADIPGPERSAATGFVINGKAYVGTGCAACPDNSNDFYEYNPITNTWSQSITADQVPKRRYATSFSIGEIAYMGLGYSDNGLLRDLWSLNTKPLVNDTVTGISDAMATEGKDLVHQVTLSGSGMISRNFSFGVTDVTATSNVDFIKVPILSNGVAYDASESLLRVPSGVSGFSVTLIGLEDTSDEQDETYTITIGGQKATGTILDNDSIIETISGLRIYPNPTKDFVYIETSQISCELYVFDCNGKFITKSTIEKPLTKYDLRFLAMGVYVFKFVSDNSVDYRKVIRI